MNEQQNTKPTSNRNAWIIGALTAAGLSVGGLFLAQNNAQVANDTNVQAQTESVLNLPATNEKVNGLDERHVSDINAINEQINRRELEMRAERDKLLQNLINVQNLDRERIIRLENELYKLMEKINQNN